MDHRLLALATFAVALGLAGCAAGIGAEDVGRDTHWLCGIEDAAIVCTAAMPKAAGEEGAYVCMPGETRSACPPPDALDRVEGLDALLAEVGIPLDVDAMPWACLLTGADQRHCARDVGRYMSMHPDGGDTPLPPDGGYDVPPTDCFASSWEEYFCAVASTSYQSQGLDVTFPCDVFDRSADLGALALEATTLPVTAGAASCAAGERAMRERSWRDAVLRGCLGLSADILVWCQQGANYAPMTGACNGSGTW